MNSAAEWIATIPAELSAREALPIIDAALRDAEEATDAIRSRYTGTLPPPPWPQHPELVSVINALQGGRTFLSGVVASGRGDVKQSRDGDIGKRLQIAGQTLYREIAVMQKLGTGIDPAQLPDMAARAAGRAAVKLAGTSLGGLLTLVAVVWAVEKFGGGGDA